MSSSSSTSIVLGILLLTFSACQEPAPAPKPETKPAKEQSDSPNKPAKTLDSNSKVDKAPDNYIPKSQLSDEQRSKLSNYRYIIGREELSTFTQLLQASSFAKTLHNTESTVFVPSDEVLKSQADIVDLVNGKQKDIDAFVGKYIVLESYSFKDFVEVKSAESINGTSLKFSNSGVITVNGVKTDGEVVSTNKGYVYYLTGTY
jgi:ribosomal protein L19